MKARNHLVAAATAVLLAACGGSSNTDLAVPAPPAENPGGGPVTNVITARFDPANAVVPFPSNLFFSGTTDLTINVPVPNPNNIGDPAVALNALDGFSTVAPWSMTFSRPPAASTIVPGQSVRLFEVTLTGPGGGVTGIVRELGAGTEFVTALSPTDTTQRTLAIVFTRPLKQITSYMAVITNGVADAQGNIATPDSTYFLTKRTSPLIANGVSTDPLLSNAQAQALEPLRQLVNSRRRCRHRPRQHRAELGGDHPEHQPDPANGAGHHPARHCRAAANRPDHPGGDSATAADRRYLPRHDRTAVLPHGTHGTEPDRAAQHVLAGRAVRPGAVLRPVARAEQSLDQPDLPQPAPGRHRYGHRAAAGYRAQCRLRSDQAGQWLAGGDLLPRHHPQPHRCPGDLRHARLAGLRGDLDGPAAAWHHRYHQSVLRAWSAGPGDRSGRQ